MIRGTGGGRAPLILMTKAKRGFASDNNAGVHPRVMEALGAANEGHAMAYGDDAHTERAVGLFRKAGIETL